MLPELTQHFHLIPVEIARRANTDGATDTLLPDDVLASAVVKRAYHRGAGERGGAGWTGH